MTATDRILSHWKSITSTREIEVHEAGFRRVIELATEVKVRIVPLEPRKFPPQYVGDDPVEPLVDE